MPFSSQPITRKQFTISMLIVMISAFTLFGMGMVISNSNRQESERKFCEVMKLTAQSAQRRVDGYRAEPPTTEAGRVQAQEAVITLSAVQNLMRQLSCPPKE